MYLSEALKKIKVSKAMSFEKYSERMRDMIKNCQKNKGEKLCYFSYIRTGREPVHQIVPFSGEVLTFLLDELADEIKNEEWFEEYREKTKMNCLEKYNINIGDRNIIWSGDDCYNLMKFKNYSWSINNIEFTFSINFNSLNVDWKIPNGAIKRLEKDSAFRLD